MTRSALLSAALVFAVSAHGSLCPGLCGDRDGVSGVRTAAMVMAMDHGDTAPTPCHESAPGPASPDPAGHCEKSCDGCSELTAAANAVPTNVLGATILVAPLRIARVPAAAVRRRGRPVPAPGVSPPAFLLHASFLI